jgi:hypothetical protein
MYRPNQHFLLIVKSDGTGSLKQFNSEQEAKETYLAHTESASALYLYSKPKRSLSSGNPADPPVFNTTKVYPATQNATAVNNINHAQHTAVSTTYTAIVNVDPCSGRPELPRETSPTPFNNYYEWVDYCKLNPLCGNCTLAGSTKFGTVVSEQVTTGPRSDISGTSFTVPSKVLSRADGVGGAYTEEAVNLPQGFLLDITGEEFFRSLYIVKGIDPALGSDSFVDMYQTGILNLTKRVRHISDGNGNIIQVNEQGVYKTGETGQGIYKPLITPMAGDSPTDFSGNIVGVNGSGFPQLYKVVGDNTTHSGTWYPETYVSNGMLLANWIFEPNVGSQPPPPANSILTAITNPSTGVLTFIPDPRALIPVRVTKSEPVYINITDYVNNVTSVLVGHQLIHGLNNGRTITWGGAVSTTYLSEGTPLYVDSYFQYYANGVGGYTTVTVGPPPQGVLVSTSYDPINVTTICGAYELGRFNYEVYTDGQGGTVRSYSEAVYEPAGTVFASCPSLTPDGDNSEMLAEFSQATGLPVNLNYTSNGEGGYSGTYAVPSTYSFGGAYDSGLPNSYSNTEEAGVGYGEAQIYTEDGTPIQFNSYDPETGDIVFGADPVNKPQVGDWLRDSRGKIAYQLRRPRMTTVTVPNGWRTSTLVSVGGEGAVPSGATTIQVQVGWIYTGRKRFSSSQNKYVDASLIDSNSDTIPVGVDPDELAIIRANSLCNLPNQSNAGPKTFYEPIDTGANGYAKWRFQNHNGFYVFSNGDGTANTHQ